MKHGMIKMLIKILVAPMHGPALVLMKKKEFCLLQRVLPHMIFMEVKELVKTFLLIVYLHWMLIQENVFGIFKRCIMMCGIGIYRQHQWSLTLKRVEKKLKQSHKQLNQGSFFYLKEQPAN